ncbi:inner membrane localized protein [Tanacetum coccineum]
MIRDSTSYRLRKVAWVTSHPKGHSLFKQDTGNISSGPVSIECYMINDGGSSSGSAFIGGFVLGGVLVGTLGAIFAPQISKALAGTDKKELLKKLPNFIYDEEKALEGMDGYDTPMSQRNDLIDRVNSINCVIDD